MLSAVYAILEPGGVFGVIDHAGNVDGDNKSLHRIDKGLAIELAAARRIYGGTRQRIVE